MKLTRYSPIATDTQKYAWNMLGSLCNSLSSIILLSIVSHTNGTYEGGIFSLAFSTAQLLYSVGVFEVRALQSTDVSKKYSFQQYLATRFVTCAIMILGGIGYAIYSYDTPQKAAAIIILCIYKATDSFCDVFQGLFQLGERIDLAGKDSAIKVTISTITFFVVILTTGNMLAACISMVIVSIIWIVFFDLAITHYFDKLKTDFNFSVIIKIAIESFPLFVGSFMLNYIVNAPKYAIDKYLSEEIQNIFGFLIMPAFVINLFSMFFFRPLLTKMAHKWVEKDYKAFNFIIIKCLVWILFLTVFASLGAYLLGIPILNGLSGLDLSPYRLLLIIIMLGGGGNAIVTLLYYTLACMRKQYTILIGYAIGFLTSIVLSDILVKTQGILGGGIAYAVSTISVVIALITIYFIVFFKTKRQYNK